MISLFFLVIFYFAGLLQKLSPEASIIVPAFALVFEYVLMWIPFITRNSWKEKENYFTHIFNMLF